MNLQFEALRAYIKTGAEYDDDNMIVKNVIFDITTSKFKINQEITKDILKLSKLRKTISDYSILTPYSKMNKYNKFIIKLSDELFDEFDLEKVCTDLHCEWKEYFHSLYELVVLELVDFDLVTANIMIKEVYKYWTLFEVPDKLEPFDRMYSLVESIYQKFRELKEIHKELIDENIESRLLKQHLKVIKFRKETIQIGKKIRDNEKVIDIYTEIINWSMNGFFI